MMVKTFEFSSLERTAVLVAQHAFFPEKPQLVRHWLEEVDSRFHRGELTVEQRSRLVSILSPQ